MSGIIVGRAYFLSADALPEVGVAEKDEVVSLLLREFEENQADWLWQIDNQSPGSLGQPAVRVCAG